MKNNSNQHTNRSELVKNLLFSATPYKEGEKKKINLDALIHVFLIIF